MQVGTQFTGSLPANASQSWFTYNWPAEWDTVWTVVPDTVATGSPEVQWDVAVERASDQFITYWITVTNLTANPINFEARFAVLNA
jgi:hypothetical protein